MTAPTPSRTRAKKRRPERREQILEIAVRLFHQRGFHATGMDDIGEEAGITGPAIYRHFDSKEEILVEAIEVAGQQFATVDETGTTVSSPQERLEQLARNHARVALGNQAMAAVVITERRHLAREPRAQLERVIRSRAQEWVQALTQVRPELSEAVARIMVFGVFTLLTSVTQHDSGLDPDTVETLLVDMAMKSLLAAPA